MKRQEIIRTMEKVSGSQGFITSTQFAKVMGVKTADHVKKKYLTGLECIEGKYYFIPDVVTKIMNDRSVSNEKI